MRRHHVYWAQVVLTTFLFVFYRIKFCILSIFGALLWKVIHLTQRWSATNFAQGLLRNVDRVSVAIHECALDARAARNIGFVNGVVPLSLQKSNSIAESKV